MTMAAAAMTGSRLNLPHQRGVRESSLRGISREMTVGLSCGPLVSHQTSRAAPEMSPIGAAVIICDDPHIPSVILTFVYSLDR